MKLYIAGVDRTSYLRSGTLEIRDRVNENSTASFVLKDEQGSYRPAVGEAVEIYDENNVLIFGGQIDEPAEMYYSA